MKALLLTAGLATRFRPHSLKIPKPLLPFWGIPQYLYGYELLKILGVREFILNQHHLSHALKQGVLKYAEKNIPLHFSDETLGILGSAGAIKKAEHIFSVNEDFILYNGDEVFFPEEGQLEIALAAHRKENRLATIIVMDHPQAGNKFGAVWSDSSQKVLGFGKSPVTGAQPYHYIGMMILNARILRHIPLKETNIIYDTLLPLLKNESICVHELQCEWYETGNEKDFIDAHLQIYNKIHELKNNHHFKFMIDKYLKANFLDFQKRPMVYYQGSANISESVQFDGFVWIQDGVSLDDGAKVKNSILLEGSTVKTGQTIENQVLIP